MAALTPLIAKMTRNDFITVVISGIIIGAIMVFVQPLIDSWSNDQRFIVASMLAIVGWLIARKFGDKAHKHKLFYRTVGNALFVVGMTIILMPLINWMRERIVS